MTREGNFVDFTRVDCRQREVPDGLPSLAKYKPMGKDDIVVVDAGSWQYRAGYSSKELPALVFDPVVHRYQSKTGEVPQHQVGRTAPGGVSRVASRTPYEDGNVILHAASVEQILDDVFSKLHVSSGNGCVLHPVFMTEVVANPPYCRRDCSELLFEAYDVPKIIYGIDGILSWHHNNPANNKNALIISIGNYTTVITMILDGAVKAEHIRRINYGGRIASEHLLQLMQCKYPTFPVKMTFWQAEQVLFQTGKIVLDYGETISAIELNPEKFNSIVQYPYSSETLAERQQKEERREALAVKRREQAQKLRERVEKQREERLNAKQQRIESMTKLVKQIESAIKSDNAFDDEREENALEQLRLFGYDNVEDLQTVLLEEQKELNRLMGIEEPKEAPDYSLLEIPSDQLTPDQVKEKRKQRLLKNAAEARERIRKEKELIEQQQEEQRREMERRRIEDFEGWRNDLYEERQAILAKIKAKQKRKEALSDRRSYAATSRLRSVVSLVHEDEEETDSKPTKRKRPAKKEVSQEEPGFGDDDADWLIYRQISKVDEREAEEEEYLQKRVTEIEENLEQHDSDRFYEAVSAEMQRSTTIIEKLKRRSDNVDVDPNAIASQLNVNVERFRSVEGLFQPSAILGTEQAGLIEAIEDLLKLIPPDTKSQLAENVFVTGGASRVSGLETRLVRELTAIFPTGVNLRIKFANDAHLDPWKGAAALSEGHENIPWITREWYNENGGERLPAISWFTNHF